MMTMNKNKHCVFRDKHTAMKYQYKLYHRSKLGVVLVLETPIIVLVMIYVDDFFKIVIVL